MTLSRRRVTDPAALRALAHPVRLALLELLTSEGARTATQAAEALGQTPANCSWHLRRLADHGFVREVTGVPGRHRPWRVVSEGLTWGDPDGGTADDALTDMLVERELQRLRAARAATAAEPDEWRAVTAVQHVQLKLTAAQAQELAGRLADVVAGYAADQGDDAEQRSVSLVGWMVPSRPAARPGVG